MKTAPLMDRRYIDENQIIDRYLMNRLSDEEMETFEQCFLEDPELVQEIVFKQRFIRGIRKADRTGILRFNDGEPSGVWHWLAVTRPSFPIIAAVSATILLLVAVLQFGQITRLQSVNENQANQIAQLITPQVNTLLVPLALTRGAAAGAEPVIRVRLLPEVEQVILTLELDTLGFDNFRLSLDRDGDGQLWSKDSDSAPPAVVLPAEQLIPGNYYLHIDAARPGDAFAPIAQFSFTVLKN